MLLSFSCSKGFVGETSQGPPRSLTKGVHGPKFGIKPAPEDDQRARKFSAETKVNSAATRQISALTKVFWGMSLKVSASLPKVYATSPEFFAAVRNFSA